jgi:hypothetical protein
MVGALSPRLVDAVGAGCRSGSGVGAMGMKSWLRSDTRAGVGISWRTDRQSSGGSGLRMFRSFAVQEAKSRASRFVEISGRSARNRFSESELPVALCIPLRSDLNASMQQTSSMSRSACRAGRLLSLSVRFNTDIGCPCRPMTGRPAAGSNSRTSLDNNANNIHRDMVQGCLSI